MGFIFNPFEPKVTMKPLNRYYVFIRNWIVIWISPQEHYQGGSLKRATVKSEWYGFHTADDIFSWWRHQMKTFSALLTICAGNSPVTVNSPHKGQWRGALMFSLICARMNGWINNREAGDLRRHRAHYDVTVMWCIFVKLNVFIPVWHCTAQDYPGGERMTS